MSFWVIMQVFVNLILLAGVGLLWVRAIRPSKDDPRLSKGLQLLQSKIAVLEDLSDRTETQVTQLTTLLENKCREIQEKINDAEKQITRIDASAAKSMEVATIFQDKIPHSEILERQNTKKYITAARMAHQGANAEAIAAQVDLSRAEIEFIAKVNRQQLQFSEADLPSWAKEELKPIATPTAGAPQDEKADVHFSLPRQSFTAQNFQEIDLRSPEPSVQKKAPAPTAASPSAIAKAAPAAVAKPINTRPAAPAQNSVLAQTSKGETVEIRPLQFIRIEK